MNILIIKKNIVYVFFLSIYIKIRNLNEILDQNEIFFYYFELVLKIKDTFPDIFVNYFVKIRILQAILY
jgi:hypothetical protein